jgi:hypothetical protein
LDTRRTRHLALTALLAAGWVAIPACQCGGPLLVSSGPSNGREVLDAGVDAGPPCGLRTCTSAGANCGPIGNGCDAVLHCGECQYPSQCGGGGVSSVCGGPNCTPRTCAQADAGCGQVGDGCGNLIQCGRCLPSGSCGGLVPYACAFLAEAGSDAGADAGRDAGTDCGEFCTPPPVCPGGGTTVSGTVYAPTNPDAGYGSPDPLPNAIVYVPGSAVEPFDAGVSCDMCGAVVSGDPVALTTSGPDGTFVLANVPVGVNIPLVIQLGRWRRQVTIPSVAGCANTALPAELTRLPRNRSEGDIPLTAMVTGAVDTIECVLRKIGIDDSEFTVPSAGGRVQLYVGPGEIGPGASDATGTAPPESALTSNPAALGQYDLVIFACVGNEVDQPQADQSNVIDYAAVGGRIYATHYSYVWLFDDPPFSSTADWAPSNSTLPGTQEVAVDSSFPKGALLAQWLQTVGASTTPDRILLNDLRNDFLSVYTPSQNWLSYAGGTGDSWPIHYTFNVPVDGFEGSQCGRVVFSDFHVENAALDAGALFPGECAVAPLTPQEKVLEFMLFDLASCVEQVQPTLPPLCTPLSCSQQGFDCGLQGDGCGGSLNCGQCPAEEYCGAGGIPGQCFTVACVPLTCAQQNAGCGPMADGCGGLLECGSCNTGSCGGGGVANQCGSGTAN